MNDKTKIIIHKGKVTTLKELFEGKAKTRRLMAALPFEEKIRMLVSLQELAHKWGKRNNVIIWNVPTRNRLA